MAGVPCLPVKKSIVLHTSDKTSPCVSVHWPGNAHAATCLMQKAMRDLQAYSSGEAKEQLHLHSVTGNDCDLRCQYAANNP